MNRRQEVPVLTPVDKNMVICSALYGSVYVYLYEAGGSHDSTQTADSHCR